MTAKRVTAWHMTVKRVTVLPVRRLKVRRVTVGSVAMRQMMFPVGAWIILSLGSAAYADNYLSPSPSQNEQYGVNYKQAMIDADYFDSAHGRAARYGKDGGIGSSSMQTQSATAQRESAESHFQRVSPATITEPNLISPALSSYAVENSFSQRFSSPNFQPMEVNLSDFRIESLNSSSLGLKNFGFNNATDSYGRSQHGGGFLKPLMYSEFTTTPGQ